MDTRWKPNVTVAAVIVHNDRFLLVEEETPNGVRLNNPAGHLDCGESPEQACIRETLEETAYHFDPDCILDTGIVRTLWMSADEIRASAARHRSPLVVQCLEDFLSGRRYPTDLIHTDAGGFL